MNKIIVIGSDHHNTLSVIRALGFKGIHSYLLVIANGSRPYITHSKYINDWHQLVNEDIIPNYLLEHFGNETQRPIVIACSDSIESVLDSNWDRLSPYFFLPGSKVQGRITYLMEKEHMSALAQKCGLNIPSSVSIDVEKIDDKKAEAFIYPCIIKPYISAGNTKSDILIFNDKESLIEGIKKISSKRVQIQKYISKDIEYQLIGCSLNEGETIVLPGASIILRQPNNTNTGFLKYIPIESFSCNIEACSKFIRATGYSGLFSMEFLRDKDGKDYFMEINFRNDGNAICVTEAGVNLPYIWAMTGIGNDISDYITNAKAHEVIVMPEFSDFKNVTSRKITLFQWIKDIKRTDAFMDFCKTDKAPFWHYIINKIKR